MEKPKVTFNKNWSLGDRKLIIDQIRQGSNSAQIERIAKQKGLDNIKSRAVNNFMRDNEDSLSKRLKMKSGGERVRESSIGNQSKITRKVTIKKS